MQDPRPVPQPDPTSSFFWEGALEGELRVQRCARCHHFQYPPEVVCTYCQSFELVPTAVSGRGVLYSYAVVERAFHQGFVEKLPYVVALVELEEQEHLRMLTNIVEAEPEQLTIGMALEVVFEQRGETALPQFRPAEGRNE